MKMVVTAMVLAIALGASSVLAQEKKGMPIPKVYLIPQETPNNVATGRDEKHAAVAVTEGILDILSESELQRSSRTL